MRSVATVGVTVELINQSPGEGRQVHPGGRLQLDTRGADLDQLLLGNLGRREKILPLGGRPRNSACRAFRGTFTRGSRLADRLGRGLPWRIPFALPVVTPNRDSNRGLLFLLARGILFIILLGHLLEPGHAGLALGVEHRERRLDLGGGHPGNQLLLWWLDHEGSGWTVQPDRSSIHLELLGQVDVVDPGPDVGTAKEIPVGPGPGVLRVVDHMDLHDPGDLHAVVVATEGDRGLLQGDPAHGPAGGEDLAPGLVVDGEAVGPDGDLVPGNTLDTKVRLRHVTVHGNTSVPSHMGIVNPATGATVGD